MNAPAKVTRPRIPHFTSYVSVEVEIDPDDLEAEGWVYQPAPAKPAAVRPAEQVTWLEAVSSLHRQAHPGQHPDPAICHEEPCRSLSLNQLRGTS